MRSTRAAEPVAELGSFGGSQVSATLTFMNPFPQFLIGILWWAVLFPVVWLVCTPIILMVGLFRRQPYRCAVTDMYGAITVFWREWGILFVP